MKPYRPMLSRRALVGGLTTLPALLTQSLAGVADVLSVMDFEPLAREALPPAHFGYIATGADDDRTVARNHDAFSDYGIRARRFNDMTRLGISTSVFGVSWASPLYLSAVSAMRAFHPDAEIAVALAARTRATHMMLSSGADTGPEDACAARGAPVWQQLYATDDWNVTAAMVKRAQAAGCTAIVLTVDSPGARNNETLRRAMRVDERQCDACHLNNNHLMWRERKRPLFEGIDTSKVTSLAPPALTTEFLDRLRAIVKTKLVIKGIATGEDAVLAIEHGADGVVVSNHGGRNEETLRASIDCLPEVVAAVRGRVPVFVDGGIRRGTDVFKALALGAAGVGIGRPQAWGLAAFGQPGVEAVLDILNTELTNIMRQAGTPSIASITRDFVVAPR
jgi:4-hydroxymandelate oxidase